MRLSLLVLILSFIAIETFADPPDWTVNPADFLYSKNLSAQLYLNDGLDNNTNNVLAAFVNGELHGVANGTDVGGITYYFMTVYSSVPLTDTLSFKVYIASEDDIFDIEEEVVFNAINTSSIYEFNSYLNIDQPISLNSFEDQSQVQDFDFDSIYLPDHLVQIDSDPIAWTYSGNTNLQVNISGDWLIVEALNSSWTGIENITVTATEQTTNAYNDSETISFIVVPDYGAPEWNTVADQKIGINQNFRNFDLDESLRPYAGSSLAYHYFMPQAMGTEPDAGWAFNSRIFQYSMNVTVKVRYGSRDHGGNSDQLLAYINNNLVGIASPALVNGELIYFLTVYSDDQNVPVRFELYDATYLQLYELPNELNFQNGSENGTPDNPLIFNTAPLEVIINNNGNVAVNVEMPGWVGTQQIAFIAYDTFQPLVNADTTYAMFEVVNEYAPEVSGIANQYVELGTAFTGISLNNHITEYDGDGINWSVIGDSQLSFSINYKNAVSITPLDSNWTGEETVVFRATDVTACGLYGEQEVTFTIGAPNQAPEILTIPEQIIQLGDTFPTLNLNDYLFEPNNDAISWTYFFKSEDLEDTNPGWTINPGSFQYSMTMTAKVNVRENYPTASGHQIAAFHEGELRGVATAQNFSGTWFYFLNIYSNQAQDSIYFQYYDPDQEAIYAIDDSVKFISQQQLGSASDPFLLYAGYIDPSDNNALLSSSIVNRDWLGTDTLYVVANELGTHEGYKDTAQIVFKVQASPVLPVDLISFTGVQEKETSLLEWSVANPDNIHRYEIFRTTSIDPGALEWNFLGYELHEVNQPFYHFIDDRPEFGKNYYRLKMIDQDGSFEYSEIISMDFGNEVNYQVRCYPNPTVHQNIYLEIITENPEAMDIQIVDNSGRNWMMLHQESQGNREFIAVDLEAYPAGQYFARIKIQHQVSTLSFVVVRE